MSSEFRAEDAGGDSAGLPSAAAVVLEAENRPVVPKNASGFVKILAPTQEVPVGLLRIECEVKEPVRRVEFYLEEKKILVKNRPPYTVELDLGKIPKKQTLKVLGFDAQGNFVDADAWAINEKDARLAVRILELPKQKSAGDTVELKVALQSIAGGEAKKLELWLDDTMVKEWTEPPFTVTVPVAKIQKATLMRATATDAEGKEFTDLKLLKGESRFMSKVEVNLVELPGLGLRRRRAPREGPPARGLHGARGRREAGSLELRVRRVAPAVARHRHRRLGLDAARRCRSCTRRPRSSRRSSSRRRRTRAS